MSAKAANFKGKGFLLIHGTADGQLLVCDFCTIMLERFIYVFLINQVLSYTRGSWAIFKLFFVFAMLIFFFVSFTILTILLSKFQAA